MSFINIISIIIVKLLDSIQLFLQKEGEREKGKYHLNLFDDFSSRKDVEN